METVLGAFLVHSRNPVLRLGGFEHARCCGSPACVRVLPRPFDSLISPGCLFGDPTIQAAIRPCLARWRSRRLNEGRDTDYRASDIGTLIRPNLALCGAPRPGAVRSCGAMLLPPGADGSVAPCERRWRSCWHGPRPTRCRWAHGAAAGRVCAAVARGWCRVASVCGRGICCRVLLLNILGRAEISASNM
jgi:hypothetical protein